MSRKKTDAKKPASKKKKAPPPKPAGHADDSGCYGCCYHDPEGRRGTCNYCYITGHVRGSTVEDCRKKVIGPKLELTLPMLLDGSNAPLRAVAREAPKREKPKVTKPTLQPWEMPPTAKNKFSREVAWKLYNEKKNDAQIARIVGVGRQSIYSWRRTHGLPAWDSRGRPKQDGTE